MRMQKINIRPITIADIEQLEGWRKGYWEGDLEIPFGYERADGKVQTGVAEKDGETLCALTSKRAVVADPLIVNPAANHADVVAAIYLLERALTYDAQRYGAVESYIAVPDQLEEYHRIVEKAGYVKTVEHCTVFRRPLVLETVPMLGPSRDAAIAAMEAQSIENPPDVELAEETAPK